MITTLDLIYFLLLLTALGVYVYLILLFAHGWRSIPAFHPEKGIERRAFISVVIALRNEEKEVRRLLEALRNQDYPRELYEVILVDDHSDDDTSGEVRKYVDEYRDFPGRMITPVEGSGKKKALNAAIHSARGEIILTTDADCSPGNSWISTFAAYMAERPARMVFGPVIPQPARHLAGRFQELEFISLVGSGAGASGAGKPFMCNGANLAFYRDDYFRVGGYESHYQIASGDDVFLLHSFKDHFGSDTIRFLKSVPAVVTTPLAPDFHSFFSQRKRWASKSFYYRDLFSKKVAFSVYLSNLLILIGLLGFVAEPLLGWAAVAALLLKGFADLVILGPVTRFANRRALLPLLPLFEVFYVLYAVITATTSFFSKYQWKGRTQKS